MISEEHETNKLPDPVIIKNLMREMGADKAYIEELQRDLRLIKELTKEERTEMKKQAIYIQQKEKITELNETVSRLRQDNMDLIMKLNGTKK